MKKRVDLNDEQRVHLFMTLLKDFNGKKLAHGSIKRHADSFGLCPKTVSRIWELGSEFRANGEVVNLSRKLSNHVGRKKVELDVEKLKEIPFRRRKTIISVALAMGMSKSSVHRRVKERVIRRHSNAIKPQLSDENKKSRLRFCLSMLQVRSYIDAKVITDRDIGRSRGFRFVNYADTRATTGELTTLSIRGHVFEGLFGVCLMCYSYVLSSDKYTLPMSPQPSLLSNLKWLMPRLPSRARTARMAFHLGSFPL